jgi:hypothetical protein
LLPGEAGHETGDRRFGIVRRGLEFRRDPQLLSAARFRRGSGGWCGERVLYDIAPVPFGALGCTDWLGILATASREAMLCAWPKAAVAVVLGMILFPQEIAAFIADRLGGAWKQ